MALFSESWPSWRITRILNAIVDGTQAVANFVLEGAAALVLKAGDTDDHVYIQFFADSSAQSTRSGYIGFSSAGSETFQFVLDGYSSGNFRFNKNVIYSDGASDTLTISQSSTLSALSSTQGIRFTPADAHDVEVYRSGSNILFKVYESSGAEYIALQHNGTYGRLNNNDGQGGLTVFDAVTVADDATSTFTAPTGRAHGIWIVTNTWDDSGYGMFAHTAQSVTQLGGGVNFQLGDAGTNPDVDGDINCWMSSSTVLSIKNRTGGNASIVVYHLGA